MEYGTLITLSEIKKHYSYNKIDADSFGNLIKELSCDFAEWLNINGIRDGQHEWKYKADNFKKKFSTQEMFKEYQKKGIDYEKTSDKCNDN